MLFKSVFIVPEMFSAPMFYCTCFCFLLKGGIVLSQLLDWLRMHFVEGDHIAREALQLETPNRHPQYWQAVSGVIERMNKNNNLNKEYMK